MLKLSSVALLWGAALLSVPSFAQAPPPPTDASPPAAAAAAPATEGATPDQAEAARLLEELQAEDKSRPPVPDLSTVNLAAGIPGVQSMNPDLSIILDVAGAAFGVPRGSKAGSPFADDPMMTGGHDPTENGFTLRQVELAFAASVDPYLRFDASLVIKDALEVEEAYATTLALPLNLQMRAGAFLAKFGRQNELHPHAWWFLSQPLVYGHLMGEDNFRGLGVEVSWLSPLPWPVTLIGELQGTSGGCCSRTFSPGEQPTPVHSPLDLVATGVIEQFFPITDDLSVLWGLSAMTGPTPYLDPAARGEIWGSDLLVRFKPASAASRWFVELTTEGMLRTRHRGASDFVIDAIVDGGAYAQLVFHPSPAYGVGVRYDHVEGLANEIAGANGGLGSGSQRGAIVLEYAPTHFARINVEASSGTRGQGDLLWGAIINLEVAVGAHGAHAY